MDVTTPEVTTLLNDGKQAVQDAITGLKAALDSLLTGAALKLPTFSQDAVTAATSIVEKLDANLNPFVADLLNGVIAMDGSAVTAALAKFDAIGAQELAIVKTRVDGFKVVL